MLGLKACSTTALLIYLLLCVHVCVPEYIHVPPVCMSPQRSEEVVKSSVRDAVTGGCELPYVGLKQNPGLLQEQPVLLTSRPIKTKTELTLCFRDKEQEHAHLYHSAHTEVKGQLSGVGSHLPLR